MKKKRNSIRFIISISFIVLITITFGIIGYFVFSSWKLSTDNIVTKMENNINENVLNQIETFMDKPLYINEINHNLIENGIVNLDDESKREIYFVGVLKSTNTEVYSFSYGNENGEYYGARRNKKNDIEIMENNQSTGGNSRYYAVTKDLTAGQLTEETGKFDARARDWYMAAKAVKKPVFSPIYKHFVMNDLAISAAYPIYDKNGMLQGVLGTHIILSKINSYLREIAKDKKTITYIVEKDSGNLVANSLDKPNFKTLADNKIKRINIKEVNNKSIVDAYEKYRKNPDDSFVMESKDDRFHITFITYKREGLNWLIITAIPEGQFTGEIIKSMRFSILLSILALIIVMIIYIKSTKIILKPIYNLIDTTEKFSKGDFMQRAEIFRDDEIGRLSNAFNIMAEQLYMFINTLEEQVKRRTGEIVETNAALKKSEENIRLILDSTAEAIYGMDTKGNCIFCNASCIKMLGYGSEEELIGKNMHYLIHYKHSDGTPLPIDKCEVLKAAFKGEGAHEEGEVLWRADGTCFPAEYFSYPEYRDGKVVGIVVTFMDISERKKSEEEILYLSYHDQLTSLYNRRYFEEELKKMDDEANYPLTIVMADMNGLKLVNDSLGHAMGDELLKSVSKIITKGCRHQDIVARLGGDEFVIIMPKTKDFEAEHIIRNIKDMALKEKVGSVDISISFGYESKNSKEENIQEILKKAEDHMYKKKLFEGPSMRGKTINTIISTLHEKNKREEAHSHRVSKLCKSMGEALHLDAGDIEELKTVGLLHDIGKIAIEESILNKPGELTDDERKEIKRHPEIGYRILSTVNDMSEMAEYVLAHHERWDGGGYPKKLKEKKIPLQSRIIAIADTYDAITSERSYRCALSEEVAVKELEKNAGTQFDAELVKVFIEKVLKRI